jgi:hypothetical protein
MLNACEKNTVVYFQFLDQLWARGINIFGASPQVAEAFGLPKADAREIIAEWMQTFDRDETAEQRAALASFDNH